MGTERRELVALLDTDVLIDFLRGRDYLAGIRRQFFPTGLPAISVVTVAEAYRGMRPEAEARTVRLLHGLVVLPIDAAIAEQAGRMSYQQRAGGVHVSLADSLIAATALHYNLVLLTNNVDDYPFPNLNVRRARPTPR